MEVQNSKPRWKILLKFIVVSCLLCLMFKPTDSVPIHTKQDALAYLRDYGFAPWGEDSSIDVYQFTTALTNFQKFFSLSVTGTMTNETLAAMNEQRCGLPDIYVTTNDIEFSRYRRFVAYEGWGRTHLTYDVSVYSRQLSKADVDEAFRRAFQIYEDATVLTFERKRDGNADILVSFYEPHRSHGDSRPFDGPGRELAHAFFPFVSPLNGDIHFDDSEKWSLTLMGENLVAVAAHEIGHSLGLSHSNVLGAIMFPYYFNNKLDVRLHPDDIMGIESLYGNGMTTTPHTKTEEQRGANNPNVPNLCHESMDAILATDDGELIILKGSYIWRATEKGIKKGFPRLISQRWAGLQNNLQTGTQLKNTVFWTKDAYQKMLFVKGKSVWRYSMSQDLDKTFPKDINKMFDLVAYKLNGVVGMFEMRQNGDIYLFGESEVYIFNWMGIIQGPFRTQEVFVGAPKDIAAVFQWTDNNIYFFTRGGMIYTFRSEDFQPLGKPKSWFNPAVGETDWLGCSTSLVKVPSAASVLLGNTWIMASSGLLSVWYHKYF